jgi:hypothetical protein
MSRYDICHGLSPVVGGVYRRLDGSEVWRESRRMLFASFCCAASENVDGHDYASSIFCRLCDTSVDLRPLVAAHKTTCSGMTCRKTLLYDTATSRLVTVRAFQRKGRCMVSKVFYAIMLVADVEIFSCGYVGDIFRGLGNFLPVFGLGHP